jgi:G6PDH family F420-dependent oxidoreductase
VSGAQSIALAAERGDDLIAVEPDADLVQQYRDAGGTGRTIGQVPISWDPSRDAAVDRAHDLFRWFAGGWKVNAELPGPAGFAAATQFVRKDDVAGSIPCGPDLDAHVGAVQEFADAGFTDVAVVQIGGDTQPAFLDWAESDLLPALRSG